MVSWFFLVAAAALATASTEMELYPRATNGTALRILPLGASVTFGVGSTTGDSWRKDLRDQLVASGREVNYVGTVRHGKFTDNDCEAFSGEVFDQLAPKLRAALPKFLPNVVTLDLGTNNCNAGKLLPDFGANVSSLIADVYKLAPGATVVLSTVYINPNANQDACRQDVNKQYENLATTMAAQKAKFVLVDMRGPNGPTVDDLADKRHPNNRGYEKMSKIWFAGFQEAESKGFVVAAASNGIVANGDLDKTGLNGKAGNGTMGSKPQQVGHSAAGRVEIGAWAGLVALAMGVFYAL